MRRPKVMKSLIVLNEILTNYFRSIQSAKSEGQKIAYVSVGFPVEILYSIDILPICIQTHAALIGALKTSKFILEDVEGRLGYAADLCSEIKMSLGIALSKEKITGMGPPSPDLVVSANNVCNQITKCAEVLSHYYKVPRFFIDMPFVAKDTYSYTLQYIKSQLRNFIEFLEEYTDQKFDYSRLWETCYQTEMSRLIWRDILQLCKHSPAPISALDIFVHMVPLSSLRGKKNVVRYYELLKLEIEERVKANDAAVPEERYRLGWDHLPIYHKTKYLSNLFSKYGGVFVVAPFLDVTTQDLTIYDQFEMNITMMEKTDLDFSKFSAEKILELLTHEYSMIYVNRNLDYKAKHISSLVDEYSLDGFVFHLNRGCKSQCLSQYRLQQIIKEKFGINSLIIDGDSMDPRFFSENQITTRIEAFMESLKKRKNSQRSNAPYSF